MRRVLVVIAVLWAACSSQASPESPDGKLVVLISPNDQWRVIKSRFTGTALETTPWAETLTAELGPRRERVLFLHGGWGKIAAAGSTQYAIDRWRPELLVNLGTCGGFVGAVDRFDTLLAERTVVYDIIERMGDPKEAIESFTTRIDLGWLGAELPTPAIRTTLVSADQDLAPDQLQRLRDEYQAVAGDWESGAIAHVARRNGTRVLILRGVSDLVGPTGGEAYGKEQVFVDGARRVMENLVQILPKWIERSRHPR